MRYRPHRSGNRRRIALVTLNYTQIQYDRIRQNIFHSTQRKLGAIPTITAENTAATQERMDYAYFFSFGKSSLFMKENVLQNITVVP
jgi:hypothetical protein